MNRASWTRHVQDYSNSGLSLETYCQQHDLKVERLTFWHRKLAKEQSRETAAFVPVSVLRTGSAGMEPAVSLTLPNGIRVNLNSLASTKPVMALVSGLMRV